MYCQFLAMKADLAFWGEKEDRESMQGLSTRTVLTQAFCSLVICAYVWHEGASLLVRIPIAISTAIDLWKGNAEGKERGGGGVKLTQNSVVRSIAYFILLLRFTS